MGAPPDLMFVIDANEEAIAMAPRHASSTCRSSPSSIRTAILMGIVIPLQQIATRPRHHPLLQYDRACQPSTASSGRKAQLGSTSAPPTRLRASRT